MIICSAKPREYNEENYHFLLNKIKEQSANPRTILMDRNTRYQKDVICSLMNLQVLDSSSEKSQQVFTWTLKMLFKNLCKQPIWKKKWHGNFSYYVYILESWRERIWSVKN